MPEIDLELRNLLQESYEERAISKGHPLTETSNVPERLQKLEHTRRLMGKENASPLPMLEKKVTDFFVMNLIVG